MYIYIYIYTYNVLIYMTGVPVLRSKNYVYVRSNVPHTSGSFDIGRYTGRLFYRCAGDAYTNEMLFVTVPVWDQVRPCSSIVLCRELLALRAFLPGLAAAAAAATTTTTIFTTIAAVAPTAVAAAAVKTILWFRCTSPFSLAVSNLFVSRISYFTKVPAVNPSTNLTPASPGTPLTPLQKQC